MRKYKWLIVNYILFVLLGIFISKVLNLSFSQWQAWALIILVIAINATAAISAREILK